MWVLLVLKAGYLTNTTYGYIKWNKYIKAHQKTDAPIDDDSNDLSDKNSSTKSETITDVINNAHAEAQTDEKIDTQTDVILDANNDNSLNVQTDVEAVDATANAQSGEISTKSEADLTGTPQQENAPAILNGIPQNSPKDDPAT